MNVYLRPLQLTDALSSWAWRNDPDVWAHTESKPKGPVTPDIEKAWLASVLERKDQRRFAICLADGNEYIGNAQLTDIKDGSAQLHIFIGAKNHWGKGYGTLAVRLLIGHAFGELRLGEVYLSVRQTNLAAIRIYRSCGFQEVSRKNDFIRMSLRDGCENNR